MAPIAEQLRPLLRALFGTDDLPVALRAWDGSVLGDAAPTAVVLRSPMALRRILYASNELGLGRAYVAGEIDIEGDIFHALQLRELVAAGGGSVRRLRPGDRVRALTAAARLGALGPPPRRPAEEVRLRGPLHSRRRDAQAISHHYDVGNDFYRLFLGETMTYSCAYFETPEDTLDDAQTAKYDVICRKLGLQPGMRLLDVGCGWGGMVMHAARHYGVDAVGVTVSRPQADLAEKRVAEAGLASRADIRLQDYRDVTDGPFQAISSIGMFEHVGLSQLVRYFEGLRGLLSPRGRLLNHAISRPSGPAGFDPNSFISRYVFPDGELHEVGTVVTAMQEHGLEVRDVESLREHYALTLRAWVRGLESNWQRAVELAGAARARIWRLYMAGAALNFEAGRTSIHQVLAVKDDASGRSGIPLTRKSFV
jgi:cyclopropane-fatty-acyl-phospholipid synthase